MGVLSKVLRDVVFLDTWVVVFDLPGLLIYPVVCWSFLFFGVMTWQFLIYLNLPTLGS